MKLATSDPIQDPKISVNSISTVHWIKHLSNIFFL